MNKLDTLLQALNAGDTLALGDAMLILDDAE